MSSCSATCSPEILPPCYSKHTVFPKKFHACMVPRQQFSRPQKVTLCRIRDTLRKKTQHDTGISCQDPCNRRFGVFFMVHVDGWYIIMFPSIFCAFSPLKEKRVQEDPDATVSNGLMVRQANWVKRNCYWMNFYRKNPQGSWNYPFLLETMRRYGEVEGFSLDSGLIWINWVCNIYWPLIAIFGKVGTP